MAFICFSFYNIKTREIWFLLCFLAIYFQWNDIKYGTSLFHVVNLW